MPTTPAVVTPPPPVVATPPQSLGVSGKVYDTGLRPLVGAKVEVLNGPHAGNFAMTGPGGQFGFSGEFDDQTSFRATMDGHEAGVARPGPYCERCNPHYWIYFYLALPVPPAALAGDYTLTVFADEACLALPAEARARNYTAKIVAQATQPTSANTVFYGTASDSSIATGLGWEGLWFYVAGDYVEMSIGDLHGQPGLLEQVGANTYFGFGGLGSTMLGADRVSTISVPFDGDVVFCELKPGVAPIDANQRFTCGADQAVSRVVCPSRRHRIVLARR